MTLSFLTSISTPGDYLNTLLIVLECSYGFIIALVYSSDYVVELGASSPACHRNLLPG